MRAKVEPVKTFPIGFRPVHNLDTAEGWEDVPVKVRGTTGVVRGAVKERGVVRLFVTMENKSLWLTPEDVEIMEVPETTIVDDGLDHSQETIADEEPEGGWVTAPTLLTGEIRTIMLCKYSGERPMEAVLPGTLQCQSRVLGRHRDEFCFMNFHSAAALLSGAVVPTADDLMVAEEVLVTGDEITYKNPIV